MKIQKVGAGIAVLIGLVLLWLWSDSALREGSSDATPRARLNEKLYSEPSIVTRAIGDSADSIDGASRNPTVLPEESEHEADHEHFQVEDPTGDLALYERSPMSSIPHRVVRGWGARGAGAVPGVVGAYVIVEAGISDDELAELARDIRRYHYDADALSVRILDSQRAATYDRHDDGGEFAAAHLLGTLNKNTHLGIDRIEIRGKQID